MAKLTQGKIPSVKAQATTTQVTIPEKVARPTVEVLLDGGHLIVSIPWDEVGVSSKPKPGETEGKSMIHASTRGNMPIVVDGKIYNLGMNVYAKK